MSACPPPALRLAARRKQQGDSRRWTMPRGQPGDRASATMLPLRIAATPRAARPERAGQPHKRGMPHLNRAIALGAAA